MRRLRSMRHRKTGARPGRGKERAGFASRPARHNTRPLEDACAPLLLMRPVPPRRGRQPGPAHTPKAPWAGRKVGRNSLTRAADLDGAHRYSACSACTTPERPGSMRRGGSMRRHESHGWPWTTTTIAGARSRCEGGRLPGRPRLSPRLSPVSTGGTLLVGVARGTRSLGVAVSPMKRAHGRRRPPRRSPYENTPPRERVQPGNLASTTQWIGGPTRQ